MKTITLKLTREQFKMLHQHFNVDLSNGVSGTHGDGDNYTEEHKIPCADSVAKLLNQIASENSLPQWKF